jgi:glucose/arabinose dehydrogenase
MMAEWKMTMSDLRRRRKWFVFASAALMILVAGPSQAQLRLQPIATSFSVPVGLVQDPTDVSVFFVVEQTGRIRIIQNGVVLPQDFLDLTGAILCCGERGLLGLAVAPDYAVSGRFYVNFTNPPNGDTVIARFKRSVANPLIADPASRFDLRWASITGEPAAIPHIPPYGNHNAGDLAFGPDGYLYIGTGDGGAGNDPHNYAQDPMTLLGKMLRIDVSVPDDDTHGYRVPTDNPFLDNVPIAALPEIWDFGMRNPWRFSFDVGPGGTGALLIADVGQNVREEINYEPAGQGGRNYGWRIREGTRENIPGVAAFLPLVDPIHEYEHPVGFVVTGGFVYRGVALGPRYQGRYFFADFATARLWSIGLAIDGGTGAATATDLIDHTDELGGPAAIGAISSFGRDSNGELYIVQYGGAIMKIVPQLVVHQVFRNTSTGDVAAWLMNGLTLLQGAYIYSGLPLAWRIDGIGDLNGDHKSDLIFRNANTGDVAVWLMNGTTIAQGVVVHSGLPMAWRLDGVGDLDGDQNDDLIFRNTSTGDVAAWLMNGGVLKQGAVIYAGLSSSWQINGVGDLNGDGRADLVFRHGQTGDVAGWLMNGLTLAQGAVIWSGVALAWRIDGIGDLNGDGKADLVFRHTQSGDVAGWLMNGLAVAQGSDIWSGVPLVWRIDAVGDLNGDRKADLVFRNTQTGDVSGWLMNGLSAQGAVISSGLPLVWQIEGLGDLDGE